MENRFEIQGNSLIIHLPKEVDHMVTDEIRRDSDDIIRKKYIRTITFDFSGTAFMDSSGIGLIMGRYRMMGMRGDCIQATEKISGTASVSGKADGIYPAVCGLPVRRNPGWRGCLYQYRQQSGQILLVHDSLSDHHG